MSGHSKWSQIKYKKAATDAKRGKLFTKIGSLISIAAREGEDPNSNFKLRLAIDQARKINMPQANIERAIKRGLGKQEGARFEEILYEGYGPGGIALLIKVATNNRNRAASGVRSILTKFGGHLGESGSCVWMFKERGEIRVNLDNISAGDKEKIELLAIDLGALEIEEQDQELYIYTNLSDLEKIKKSLEESNFSIDSAEVTFSPKQEIKISDQKTTEKILKFLEALEELEDVTDVQANFDISEELISNLT